MNNKTEKKIKSIYKLSPMQKGMLFHTIYNPESEEYFEQLTATLKGDINIEAFERAWQSVVDNNDILRTSFVYKKVSKMLQVVNESVKVPIDYINWSDSSVDECELKFQELMIEERKRGFHLSKAPLLRIKLIKYKNNYYKLLWSHHHILMDGWSLPILLKEVFTYYELYSAGIKKELPRKRPYKDFISWLNKKDLKQAENFWKSYLEGFESPTQIPIKERVKTENLTESNYKKEKLELDNNISERIVEIVKQNKITINSFLQAVWVLLLAKYSGENDVVFGATFSGRPTDLAGSELMLGLFINTLPVRAKIDSEVSLTKWITDFHQLQIGIKDYEYTPLYEIQKWTDTPAKEALFDSIFVFENYPVDSSLNKINLSFEITDVHTIEKTNYPLTVVSSSKLPLTFEIAYEASKIKSQIVRNILTHIKNIIEFISSNKNAKIKELKYLDNNELEIYRNINRKVVEFNRTICIHQKFEQIVNTYKNKIAITINSNSITYFELNRKANQLANFLRDQGIKPEAVVGLYADKSIELLIGVMGILKAGGVYLPIDPTTPDERVRYILDDSNPFIILTQEKYVEKFKEYSRRVITIDTENESITKQSDENPLNNTTVDNLAYIIYTSGSTGKPKGTLLQHSGVLNLVESASLDCKINEAAKVLQFASINFDASIIEMFSSLLTGAELVLIDKDNILDVENLLDLLDKYKVTFAILPPSLLSIIKHKKIPSLKIITSAGEACPVELGDKWSKDYTFYNGYGPTEATVGSIWGQYKNKSELLTVPLGSPIYNVDVYVLDNELNRVPLEIPGEVYISGDNLARGYLGRPDLTAEKFLPNPYSSKPGSRMYKTGDLVKVHLNSEIEFIDRVDSQIKIRGFRIEIGEIENVLMDYKSIKLASVLVKELSNKDKILVAFLVEDKNKKLNEKELNTFLKAHLPEYMIPKTIIILDELPSTINGKIDRKKLATININEVTNEREDKFVDPTVELIMNITKELTGKQNVTLNDNFFEVGGHSILATQAVSRIREAFGIEISLKEFFEAENLKSLAELINNHRAGDSTSDIAEIKTVDRKEKLPLSFSQQRLWFLNQFAPEQNSYNIPAILELEGELNEDALSFAINKMIERHEVLRSSFINDNGKPKLIISKKYDFKIDKSDLSQLDDQEKEEKSRKIIEGTTRTNFNLTQLQLFKVKLIKLNNDRHICAIVMHHIISDGWSVGIIVKEISELYRSFINSTEPQLEKLSIQYVDYAAWQKQFLSGVRLQKEIEFWENELDDASFILNLPTDKPRPTIQTFNGTNVNFKLDANLSEQIDSISSKLNITPYMFLLGVFEILLSKYSRQNDFLIGTPIANRTNIQTEKLIGFFVNTLAIRVSIDENKSVQDLMKTVRAKMLNAYSHQFLPFEKLVEVIQPERDTSRSPLFQVAFVFQNTPVGEIEIPGLKVKQHELEGVTANYDMTLYMQKRGKVFNGTFEFNTDIFEKSTIERIIKTYTYLIANITEEPKQRIAALELLPEDESQKILYDFNQTDKQFISNKCVHERFENIANETPEAIALTFTEVEEKLAYTEQLTYGEVNRRANKLANYLIKKGISRESIVGISLPRSFEMIISMIAILKAGAAFLPIDSTYPEERIKYMLSDSNTGFLITNSSISKSISYFNGNKILVDDERSLINEEESNNLNIKNSPLNLAYIIYTSGSTGKPKGTMLNHLGVFNLSLSQKDAFRINKKSKILQFSSFSFDASVWEFVMALMNGASLSLVGQDIVKLGTSLLNVLKVLNITTITLPPSVLAIIPAETGDKQNGCPDLDTIIVAGEQCPAELVEKWGKNRRFVNAYGPTETTVCASMHITDGKYRNSPPIGKPIYNYKLFVLDKNLLPVPIGVPGELYISGPGLARGYLNKPSLTSEKFLPNPYSKIKGDRMYKSGDLVKYLPNGELEFLGRVDNQVKLRGFRIELGEIESILRSNNYIKDVVVDVKKDNKGGNRLIAYIVLSIENVEISNVRQFVRERLPDYMVPQYFILLDKIPLTPNEKIDRKALPKPDVENMKLNVEYVEPRNDTERKLVDIIRDLLNIEKVGIYDNFFDLGGHSLLATQFVSKIKEILGFDVPLRELFENPTVENLALLIQGNKLNAVDKNEKIEKQQRGSSSIEELINELEIDENNFQNNLDRK